MSKYNLEIGKIYKATTCSGLKVMPIKQIDKDRALFVTEAFDATPFVAWYYTVTGHNTIELASGRYYSDLDEALTIECKRPSTLSLIICTECEDCNEECAVGIDLSHGLQSAIEQIEDAIPCTACGSLTIHTTEIRLTDGVNDYTLTD